VVGGWLQIHQPEVLPPYFEAIKKNPAWDQPLCFAPLVVWMTEVVSLRWDDLRHLDDKLHRLRLA
jgi:hypothetical protein